MNRMNRILILVLSVICCQAIGQSSIGAKIGYGANMQRWNDYQRDPLFTPCIDVFIESNDDPLNKFYASLGYHQRGSLIRGFNLGFSGNAPYRFNNAVLEVGGKRMGSIANKLNGYYMLGVRAEYTFDHNLDNRLAASLFNLTSPASVRRFNYGVSVGGGFERPISEDKILFIELAVNPDLSKQIEQLQIIQYTDGFGQQRFTSPQEVRNLSLELRIGIKFVRTYEEEDY